MTWADLDWPDLSPKFPKPQPSPPPARPDVPADIAEQVRRAERRRGIFVPLCVLVGSALFCAGVGMYRFAPPTHQKGETCLAPTVVAVLLMLVGLLVAMLVPALVVLLVIGPSWQQRQQHLAVLRYERERRAWLAGERGRYLADLPVEVRNQVLAALGKGP